MARKNEEVKPGTLILAEKPFVFVLNSKYRTKLCDNCFSTGELRQCGGCHYVFYCGRECQKGGWHLHKQECAYFKKNHSREIPNAARLLAKLVKKLKKHGNSIKSYYGTNKFRMFKDLMSHYPHVKEDSKRLEHFTTLCGVLKFFLGVNAVTNTPELLGIYGRMCINSFNICDEELNSVGTGIYLAASILDHSCQPNAVAIFKGTEINIRTTHTLPSLDWNKVSISYVDTLQLPNVRQEELLTTYYFLCECPRCTDPEEIKLMTAAACPNSKCDSCIDIKNYDQNDNFKCDICQTSIPSTLAKEYEEVTELSDYHLKNMKLAYLDVCQVCLKKQEGVLHTLNIQRVRILDSAFESSIDFKQWDDAKKFGIELLNGYRKYLGEIHPLTGLLYLKLAKILIYQESTAEARGYLKQASKILKITHGDCNLFKREVVPLYHSLSY